MIPYTPQQNGVVERKNITIIEMERCIFSDLLSFLRGEVVNTTIHTLNRCPMKVVEEKIMYEAWTRKKPNISHFRIFSCDTYAFITSEKREKLDKISKKCIFVVNDSEHKGYRLYSPSYKAVFLLRDVKFNEIPKEVASYEDLDNDDDSFVAPN